MPMPKLFANFSLQTTWAWIDLILAKKSNSGFKSFLTKDKEKRLAKRKKSKGDFKMNQYIALSNTFDSNGNLVLKGNALSVLMAIKKFYPHSFPSIKKICEITDLCKPTVLKYLRKLEEFGVIQILNRKGTSNLYKIAKRFISKKEEDSFSNYYESIREKFQFRFRQYKEGKVFRNRWIGKKVDHEMENKINHVDVNKVNHPHGKFSSPQSTTDKPTTNTSTKDVSSNFNIKINKKDGMQSIGSMFCMN